jgi:hypothetical protein
MIKKNNFKIYLKSTIAQNDFSSDLSCIVVEHILMSLVDGIYFPALLEKKFSFEWIHFGLLGRS